MHEGLYLIKFSQNDFLHMYVGKESQPETASVHCCGKAQLKSVNDVIFCIGAEKMI